MFKELRIRCKSMDITNRIVKICRRITEIEYYLACNAVSKNEDKDLQTELKTLEIELETLQPATY